MNISSRCDYACRAIVELARNAPKGTPLTATAIAHERNIPEKYLVHILLQLKKAGLVTSVRGAQGGYRIALKTDEVSLLDIVLAVDGPVMDPPPSVDESSPELQTAWEQVAKAMEKVLKDVTIQDIMDNTIESNMYFI